METSDQYIALVTGTLFIAGVILAVYKLWRRSKMQARWMR
jgi:hypothetical protein